MERGKHVSRSIYQKVCEENKKLKSDIFTLVMSKGVSPERILVKDKWERKFNQDQYLKQMLHDYAVQYVKDNPDSTAAQIAKYFPLH